MFQLHSRPSIFLGDDDHLELQEIGECLKIKSFLLKINLALTTPLGQTISSSVITLDQQLPAKLENYMMQVQPPQDAWSKYISKLTLIEQDNPVDHNELKPFAKLLVIENKEEKQFQVIKTESHRQIGFQQKKIDGLLSNQIVNSKINNTRSISPQPMSVILNKTQSQSQSQLPIILAQQTESQVVNEQMTRYNPNSSYMSSKQYVEQFQTEQCVLNKWNDKSKEKILFQDHYIVEEQEEEQNNFRGNKIVVKKSEDPQFFQQLKNARVASPTLRQVKGSGISPESHIKSKSKSPEVVQINLPKNCKKWEVSVNQQQSQKSNQLVKQNSQVKLPDHFKKLLNDSKQRQCITKPFDSNNTKYSQKQQSLANNNLQPNQIKSTSSLHKPFNTELQLEDSLSDNYDSIPVNKQLPFKLNVREQNSDERVNYYEERSQEPTKFADLQLFMSEQQRNKSQNKKSESEKVLEQLKTQNQSIRDQFSFKPQFDQQRYQKQFEQQEPPRKINAEQLVESKSLRGISPLIRSTQQQQLHLIQPQPPIPSNQQKEPIQIKLDIKQFMNSNRPKEQNQQRSISPIGRQQFSIKILLSSCSK